MIGKRSLGLTGTYAAGMRKLHCARGANLVPCGLPLSQRLPDNLISIALRNDCQWTVKKILYSAVGAMETKDYGRGTGRHNRGHWAGRCDC